jgi:shikimate dehydrogenase
MKKCAVIGSPIEHSRSPEIHHAFAEQFGIDLNYTKEEVSTEGLEAFIKAYFTEGVGLNVTLPHKSDVYRLADRVTPSAKAAKAANTLYMQNGDLVADNTDGRGLLQDITHHLGWTIKGKRVLVIGAGGAARGILQPLLSASPEQVVIFNRTESKARELANEFRIDIASPLELAEAFDFVINASSAGLNGQLPDVPASIIEPHTCVYDMIYSATDTPFIEWARAQGAIKYSDGLGMLVEQAAESFNMFFGKRPITRDVLKQLKASLG